MSLSVPCKWGTVCGEQLSRTLAFRVHMRLIVVLNRWKAYFLLLTVGKLFSNLSDQHVVFKLLSRLHNSDDSRLNLSVLRLPDTLMPKGR